MADREIDASILEACRRGDREAFRALYEVYQDKVYSICLYFFHGDDAEAADVTQEVFLKLFAGIAGFRGDAGFSTWLYRLTQNACLDASRRKAARERLREAVRADDRTETTSDDVVDPEAVQAALSSLPPQYRLPILLRYFEDLSYEEMSKTLNCSMGTVASRLNRGHKMLAGLLAPQRRAGGGRDV